MWLSRFKYRICVVKKCLDFFGWISWICAKNSIAPKKWTTFFSPQIPYLNLLSHISSRPMDMILKLLHDALYMGETARHYQIHVKHMYKYWPHLIIDQHCYHCHHTVSSYQHEFFDCGITPQLWAGINSILDSAQLPARLQSIADLPEFLFDAHNPEFNLRRIVTKLIPI